MLPNEILVSIVSFLPLKEAGATSVLSRPWQNVWKYTTNLNFDSARFFIGTNINGVAHQRELRNILSSRYVNWVNRVVDQHRGQSIERFRASFYLDSRFARSIDHWIQFAMEKGVQILELEFLNQYFTDPGIYTIPDKLLVHEKGYALEHLNADTLSQGSCAYNIGLKFLKVLRLSNVGLSGDVVEYLLSNCRALETLSMNHVKNLINLRVVGPLIALKHLVIRTCFDLKSIEICDTNIVSFHYYAYNMIDLNLSNVPLLVEAIIYKECYFPDSITLTLSQLSRCLSHLEILKLDVMGAVSMCNDVVPFFYVRIPLDYAEGCLHSLFYLSGLQSE